MGNRWLYPEGDRHQRPLVPCSHWWRRLKPGVSLPGAAGLPILAYVEVDFTALLSYNSGVGGTFYGPFIHH